MIGICPRCEQSSSGTLYCSYCGWGGREAQDAYDSRTRGRFMMAAVSITAVIIAGFFQIRLWNEHSIDMIPIQLQSLMGPLDASGNEHLAAACLDRKFYDCVENTYSTIASQTRNPAHLFRLAKFQMSESRYDRAVQTFRVYYATGAVDAEADYYYAKALGQAGQVDEASSLYEKILASKPGVIQITVIKNYVNLLLSVNRVQRPKALIKFVHENFTESTFMNRELASVEASVRTAEGRIR